MRQRGIDPALLEGALSQPDHVKNLGDFERYLVDSRRVSFQQMDTAKEVFRQRVGRDLAADNSAWATVQQIVDWRTRLVHRAGIVADGSIIRVDEAAAMKGIRAVEIVTGQLSR